MSNFPARVLSGRYAEEWSDLWIAAWYVSTGLWVGYGFWARDFSRAFAGFAVFFGPMEYWGVRKANDKYPPLTHVIRRRFPSWLAFPVMFATITALVARSGALEWYPVGLLAFAAASLGWLTEHFIATYSEVERSTSLDQRTRRAA
jgi:hypothetical protein